MYSCSVLKEVGGKLEESYILFPVFQVVSDAMLAELKECFLEAYDDNQDGKIDIREVRKGIKAGLG